MNHEHVRTKDQLSKYKEMILKDVQDYTIFWANITKDEKDFYYKMIIKNDNLRGKMVAFTSNSIYNWFNPKEDFFNTTVLIEENNYESNRNIKRHQIVIENKRL